MTTSGRPRKTPLSPSIEDGNLEPHLLTLRGTLLSDKRIEEELESGNVVINPFDARQLGTNSYDCRLGKWFYRPSTRIGVEVDFTNEIVSREFWGKPLQAEDGWIHVQPGETILAHTIEKIGGRNGFTASMRARSSIGRSGLSVAKCSGLGDVGYISRWTMEISNHSRYKVKLPVGLRVCQIIFYEVGPTLKEYDGKYGKEWTPEDMTPKLFRDYDIEEIKKGKYFDHV